MRKSNKAAANVSNVPAIIENEANNEAAKLENVAAIDLVNGTTIDNETGETVIPASATEAKPDERVARAERIAADRAAVHALYAGFELNRASVPVKAISAFKLAATTAHPIARNVSIRQCAALAVAFAASGRKLSSGARAPRTFEINGVPSAIENGVLRDAVSSGLVTVAGDTPETEIITLTKSATAAIISHLGSSLLDKAGILPAAAKAKAAA